MNSNSEVHVRSQVQNNTTIFLPSKIWQKSAKQTCKNIVEHYYEARLTYPAAIQLRNMVDNLTEPAKHKTLKEVIK